MPVRARDLRANIIEMGFERGVVHTLELLLDEHVQTRNQMRQLAELQNDTIDQVGKFLTMGEGIRRKVDQMQRDKDQGEAIDHGDPV